MDDNVKYERALKKLLGFVTNLTGRADILTKRIEALEKQQAHVSDECAKQDNQLDTHIEKSQEFEVDMKVLKEKVAVIKSDDLKNIHAFLKLVATKKGLKSAVQLLRDYDIKNLAESQVTWPKLIAGVTAITVLLNAIIAFLIVIIKGVKP